MLVRIVAAIVALTFITACETVKGVGRDIESAGEALDDAVDN